MTYQLIYSSASTMPMQADDLEELLRRARHKNRSLGVSGALIYAEGIFLQVLEGPGPQVAALMATIRGDVRHETVSILREGEVPIARFSDWNMAYVEATPRQVARWTGTDVVTGRSGPSGADLDDDLQRTARFAQDILALLSPAKARPAEGAA